MRTRPFFKVSLFILFICSSILPGVKHIFAEETRRPLEDIIAEWKKENSNLTPIAAKFKADAQEFLRKNDARLSGMTLVDKGSVKEYPTAASSMENGDLLYKANFNGGYVLAIKGAGAEETPRLIKKSFIIGRKGSKQLPDNDIGVMSIAVLRLGKNTPELLQTTLSNAHGSTDLLVISDDGSIEQKIGSFEYFDYADIDNDGVAEVIEHSNTFDRVLGSSYPESLRKEIADAGYEPAYGKGRSFNRYDIYKWKSNRLEQAGFFYE